ncbi:MAG: hypothetical protein IKT52_00805 [Oscillospiraceae bacterium]|nr:hypothetical protein [Oscillospiraceae bacterium]
MNISCEVIKDILPLYAENMVSQATCRLVDDHLCSCDGCTQFLAQLLKQPEMVLQTDTDALHQVRKAIQKRRILTVLLCFFLTAAAATGTFAFLTRPIYLTPEEAEVQLVEEADMIYYEFGDRVDCFSISYAAAEDRQEVTITAYYRLWNVHYGNLNDYRFNRQISDFRWGVHKSDNLCIRYGNSETGREDTLLWGQSDDHCVSLPRLVLNYYVIIALALLAVFSLAAWLLRKKKGARTAASLALVFFAYIVSSYIVMGRNLLVHVTADLPWYLGMIVVCTVLLWAAGLCAWHLLEMRRKDCGI